MNIKKTRYAILISSLIVALAIVAFIYFKLYGLKQAFEELVDSKTNGQYSLVIGHSSIDVLSMSSSFDSVTIQRNSSIPQKGIRRVIIPKLEIRLASFLSILRSKQLDIKVLTIDEPSIEIDSSPTQQSRPNLTQEVVKLYPAIEALLESFNIEYFYIKRASLNIQSKARLSLKLNLIDLLIEEWNIRRLSDNRQLQLTLAEQQLIFEKSTFSFSAIEYNFRKRQLQFSNFNYSSVDTITQSIVNVRGESLVMEKLDYGRLFEGQRLTYQKVKVENPIVYIHLNLGNNRAQANERELITRILKQAIGECSVDSVNIRNANFSAVLAKNNDSIKIELPRLNFKLHTFKVTNDSSTFQVGEAEIDLEKTSVALPGGLTVSCRKILFDRERSLTLRDLEVYDASKGVMIASCGSVRLHHFLLLPLIFDKQLLAHSVYVEDADIQLYPERITSQSKGNHSVGLSKLEIHNMDFKNVAIKYSGNGNKFSLVGLSLIVSNLKKSSGDYQFKIKQVRSDNAYFKLHAKNIEAHAKTIDFDGQILQVGEVDLHKDNLNLLINDVIAESDSSFGNLKNASHKHWKRMVVNSIRVTGKLPESSTAQSSVGNKTLPEFSIEDIGIKNIVIALHHEKMNIACSGKNVSLTNIASSDSGKLTYGILTGTLSKVKFEASTLTTTVGNIDIRFPEFLLLNSVIITKDNMEIKAPAFSIHSVELENSSWKIGSMITKSITLNQYGKHFFNADSIKISAFRFGAHAPISLGDLEIFRPKITLPEKQGSQHPTTTKKPIGFDQIDHFIIHPGTVLLPQQKVLSFGKIEGNGTQKDFACDYLHTETEKMFIRVSTIHLKQNQLLIDSLLLKPREQWFSKNLVEESKITASIFGIRAVGFSLDSALLTNKIKNIDMVVDSFSLDATRDKRLPDPPEKKKSATLAGMIKLPKNISINTININQGKIRVAETSEKTGQEGKFMIDNISAYAQLDNKSAKLAVNMQAKARLYNDGLLSLTYATIDSSSFKLDVRVSDFDMTKLNQIVTPLQAIEIKSGYLNQYNLNITGNDDGAFGTADITYRDLHLKIFKRNEPEKKNLGSELVTLLADGVILKHSRANATSDVKQPRSKHKSTFNLWIKSAVHGAMRSIRGGNEQKTN